MTDQNTTEKDADIQTKSVAEQINDLNATMKRTSEMLSRLDRLADRMIAVGKEQAERGGEIAPKIVRDCETWIVKEGGDPPLFFQSEAEAQHYANWKASGLPWAEYVAYNSREEAKRREQKRADDLRAKWLKYNEDEARRLQEAACRSVSRLREMISEEEIAALKARIAEVQARWSELTYEQLEHGRDQIWDYEYYLARRLGILTSEPAYGFIKYSSEEAI